MAGVNPGWMRSARWGRGAEVDRIGMLDGWQRELLGELADGASIEAVSSKRGTHPSKVKRQLDGIYRTLDIEGRGAHRGYAIVRAVGLYVRWDERQRLRGNGLHVSR